MYGLSSTLRVLVDPWDGVRPFLDGGRWAAAVVLLCLGTALAGTAVGLRWNAAPAVTAELRAEGEASKTSEQELQELVARKQRTKLVAGVADGLFGVPFRLGALAVALWFVAWLMGRSLPLGKAWQVAALAAVPVALAQFALAAAVFRQGALELKQVEGLLPSHLGAWLQAEGARAELYRAVDLFQLWAVGLMGLGFAEGVGLSRTRGLLLSVFLFALYVGVFRVGVPGLLSGGGGKP
ncbi:MAG: hypothetical protein RL653_287 [Pseudomonadota bacterium]|jgi:hypothetical protein